MSGRNRPLPGRRPAHQWRRPALPHFADEARPLSASSQARPRRSAAPARRDLLSGAMVFGDDLFGRRSPRRIDDSRLISGVAGEIGGGERAEAPGAVEVADGKLTRYSSCRVRHPAIVVSRACTSDFGFLFLHFIFPSVVGERPAEGRCRDFVRHA